MAQADDARAKAAADEQKASSAEADKAKADADRAKQKKEYDVAAAEASKLTQEAIEAHAKADQKAKTPEQIAAEEADQKAAVARAKAAALHPDANPIVVDVTVPVQRVKLNVPGHPAYAPNIPTDDESKTVTLFHISEDGMSRVHTRVHPDMVGDYMRGGWQRV